jgi:hypothetical protein
VTTITGLKEGLQVKVVFSSNKERELLMEGFVQSIIIAQNSTMFKSKAMANVVIKHNAIRLAGSPPVSFAYTTQSAPNLQTLYLYDKLQLYVNPIADPNGDAPTDIYPGSAFIEQITRELGVAAAAYPTALLEYIAQSLADQWGLSTSMEEPEELVKKYDPANLEHLSVASINLAQTLVSVFSQNFPNTNAWEAMRNTARYMMLDIVPFNRGVYVGNPNSLLREPDLVIKASEYVDLSDTTSFNLKEPVDGIAVLNPLVRVGNSPAGSIIASWPPNLDESGDVSEILPEGRYYHFKEFPKWLASFHDARFGPANTGDVNEENPGTTEPDNKPAQTKEDYVDLGARIAKEMYARARITKKKLGIILPFRTDIMPGSVVSIQKPPAREDYFVSENLVGYVTKVFIEGDLSAGQGRLQTSINVAGARTEEENEDDNLTFEEHPLYQGRWVGIDLNGNILPGLSLPEHDPLEAPTNREFNGLTAQGD